MLVASAREAIGEDHVPRDGLAALSTGPIPRRGEGMPKHKRMLCLVRSYNGPLNLIDQEMVYTRHLPADFSILDFWLQGVPYCRVRQCQTAHHIHVRNMSHFRILHGYHRQAIV